MESEKYVLAALSFGAKGSDSPAIDVVPGGPYSSIEDAYQEIKDDVYGADRQYIIIEMNKYIIHEVKWRSDIK